MVWICCSNNYCWFQTEYKTSSSFTVQCHLSPLNQLTAMNPSLWKSIKCLLCVASVFKRAEIDSFTKNLHSSKAMWSTVVNHCKQDARCITLLTQLHGLTFAPSPYMVHEWVGLVFIYWSDLDRSPSLVPDRLQDSQRDEADSFCLRWWRSSLYWRCVFCLSGSCRSPKRHRSAPPWTWTTLYKALGQVSHVDHLCTPVQCYSI